VRLFELSVQSSQHTLVAVPTVHATCGHFELMRSSGFVARRAPCVHRQIAKLIP